MTYNKRGLIYMMKLMSLNSSKYYLPEEIRKLIWHYSNDTNIISCINCDRILVDFNINYTHFNNELMIDEYYSIVNGVARCYNCIN